MRLEPEQIKKDDVYWECRSGFNGAYICLTEPRICDVETALDGKPAYKWDGIKLKNDKVISFLDRKAYSAYAPRIYDEPQYIENGFINIHIREAIRMAENSLLKEKGEFSIWEITQWIKRYAVSDPYYVIVDEDGNRYDLKHRFVKSEFLRMTHLGLSDKLVTNANGVEYRVFYKDDNASSNAVTIPSHPSPSSPNTKPAQIPPMNDIESYIARNGGEKTLKQIQSRFKEYRFTCADLLSVLYNRALTDGKSVSGTIIKI